MVMIEGQNSIEIEKIELVDMNLRRDILSYQMVDGDISINIEKVRPGFYVLMVKNKMGNYRIGKLLVE